MGFGKCTDFVRNAPKAALAWGSCCAAAIGTPYAMEGQNIE
jgi:hypothetical protein